MKKSLLLLVFMLSILPFSAQQTKHLVITRNDGGVNVIPQATIDSIAYSQYDIDGHFFNSVKSQLLYTKEREYIIPLASVNEVKFNIQEAPTSNLYYSVEPTTESLEWDSLLVTSNGYCAAIKTDSNNVITIAIDAIASIDASRSIIAQLNEDLSPISIIANNRVYNFVNYRGNTVDIIITDNGETNIWSDIVLSYIQQNARTRAIGSGISQNNFANVVSGLYSAFNIVKGGSQSAAEATMASINIATQNGLSAESNFVLSLSGISLGLGVGLLAGLTWPTLITGALIGGGISVWKYIEDKLNENKIQSYKLFVGDCEVETLEPERTGHKSYRIGVKVKKSSTIPQTYKGYNTYGLLLRKLNVTEPYVTLNIYDNSSMIVYQQPISNDGEFYVPINEVEAGRKYAYRAFILPYAERISYEIGKGSAISSFAYYGEPKQFEIYYATIKDYKQKNVTFKDGKLKFTADVTAEFNNTAQAVTGWGVCLYKDGILVTGSDRPISLTQKNGTVTIEFEADNNSITKNYTNYTATTKDHWSVGTYVEFSADGVVARDRSEDKVVLDLIYKAPMAITGDFSDVTHKSAIVKCSFHNVPNGATCGVEYMADENSYTVTTASSDGEKNFNLSGLRPSTTYSYRPFIEYEGEFYYGETKSFTTEEFMPDVVGTWQGTQLTLDDKIYETFSLTLNSDGTAVINETGENILNSGKANGTWSVSSDGTINVEIVYYSTDTQWSTKSLIGTVDDFEKPSRVEGRVYWSREHIMGGHAEYEHKFEMSR